MSPPVALREHATPHEPQPHLQSTHQPAPEAPVTGWPDVDALGLVRPGRVTLLDVGCALASDVAFGLLAGTVATGKEAVVVDGGNWLDAYRLGDAAARVTRGARGPTRDQVLDGVRVARGFTVYQFQSLVEDALPAMLADARGHVGLVVASMLPELYLDVDVAPSEARALAKRALARLRELAREHDVPVVVTNATMSPTATHPLRRVLEDGVHEVAGLHPAHGSGLLVRVPRRGLTVLAARPGARQRRLHEFVDVAPRDTGPGGHFASHLPDVHLARLVSNMRRVSSRAGEQRWLREERKPVVVPVVKAEPQGAGGRRAREREAACATEVVAVGAN